MIGFIVQAQRSQMRKMRERSQTRRACPPLGRRLRRAWWWRVDAPDGEHFL
jgi:hypothetical protein